MEFQDRIRDEQYPYYMHFADDLYGIPLPMPSIIGSVNVFLVRSPERDLLIDCGGNSRESFQTLFDALEAIGVAWDRLDVFVTHLHIDHLGGLDQIWRDGMRVYAGFPSVDEHRRDMRERRDLIYPMWETYVQKSDAPEKKTGQLGLAFCALEKDIPITQLHEGDSLICGRYTFDVLETPGHERNELCLWEREKGILFCGDIAIKGMYSSIYPRNFDRDEAREFLETLERMKQLPITTAYSGHNSPMNAVEFRDVCDKQIDHHRRRINDAYRLVQRGHHFLMDILYHYTYLHKRRHWEDCHDVMRWDLTVEMAGYLTHLVHEGKLRMEIHDDGYYFYCL